LPDREKAFRFKVNTIGGGDYPMEMIIEFLEYWVECGENDVKMRFEKQPSFDIGKRLARWEKNNLAKSKKSTEKIIGRQDMNTVISNASGW
jgi:hypothetical protein